MCREPVICASDLGLIGPYSQEQRLSLPPQVYERQRLVRPSSPGLGSECLIWSHRNSFPEAAGVSMLLAPNTSPPSPPLLLFCRYRRRRRLTNPSSTKRARHSGALRQFGKWERWSLHASINICFCACSDSFFSLSRPFYPGPAPLYSLYQSVRETEWCRETRCSILFSLMIVRSMFKQNADYILASVFVTVLRNYWPYLRCN